MRVFLFAGLLTLATGGVGFAASCEQNFKSDGVPLVTSVSYRSTQSFTGVKSSAALQRLAQAIAAEGFSGIKVNKQLASIEAFQETTGSGRIQTLRPGAGQEHACRCGLHHSGGTGDQQVRRTRRTLPHHCFCCQLSLSFDGRVSNDVFQAQNPPLTGDAAKLGLLLEKENGSGGGIRTPDTRIMIPLL